MFFNDRFDRKWVHIFEDVANVTRKQCWFATAMAKET